MNSGRRKKKGMIKKDRKEKTREVERMRGRKRRDGEERGREKSLRRPLTTSSRVRP